MEYRNGDFVISKYGIFRKHSTENSNFIKLFIRTSDGGIIKKIKILGFNNKYIDAWGDFFYSDLYELIVPITEIECGFRVYTHTVFKDEECQAVELKGNKVKLVITSQKLALELRQDYYNGFQWEVNENELDEIWEEIAPIEGFPFPKDYPSKIILYNKNTQ